ncbi:intraflagellar transport protein 46 homolog [Nasonia vitripennis]|uniref:Intraflagellar transport protein 46 homolog n=1 Tax=Nasonia vitripennis TaxID=7425 RepID=A0A7M7H7J0_NASVI|nr:intraflagellar transport protein 46 homolog [Nasonia vitripennis]
MDVEDSSEEEQRTQDIAAFTKFDESIEVRNAEEIKSPVSSRRVASMKRRGSKSKESSAPPQTDVRSPRATDFRRYSVPDDSFNKSMGLDSETSDSEDSEDMDAEKMSRLKLSNYYDSKQFEDLEASTEVKELFQNITRYTPQKIELQYKLIPFIPDYIPAVGDIDAFLKVPRPDGVPDQVGLTVLDEPAAEQSEPAVLHLQLRSRSRSAVGASKTSVVKRLEDASKQGRLIDKWIEDMGQLHRSKHPPAAQLTNKFPEVERLLQPWPAEIEEKLYLEPSVDFEKLDCALFQLIDLLCAILDIPVYGASSRIESLHTLFALYTEVHNVDIQRIHNF